MTGFHITPAEHGVEGADVGKIPDLTEEVSLSLSQANELLTGALEQVSVSTECDNARKSLRRIEHFLMIAQEKIEQVQRQNLNIFRAARGLPQHSIVSR